VTEDRADWLSTNILASYKDKQTIPMFTVVGNPILDEGDCITVQDAKNHSV